MTKIKIESTSLEKVDAKGEPEKYKREYKGEHVNTNEHEEAFNKWHDLIWRSL